MAYTSEIDKLERRLKENPKGLTFAPLAEQYRKIGDLSRALEVLKTGLELHPNYVAGNIVLGRCHFDLGNYEDSSNAFRRVLESDAENVIALQALADINERQSDFDACQHWLDLLLSIDAGNDQARQQRERLDLLRAQQEHMNRTAVPEERLSASHSEPDGEPTVEVTPVRAAESEAASEPEPETVPQPEPVLVEEPEPEPEPVPEPEPEPITLLDVAPAVEEEEELTLVRDERTVKTTTEFVLDEDPLGGPPSVVEFDVGVERHEEIVLRPSSTSEFQVPSDAELLGGGRSSGGHIPAFEEDAPVRPSMEETAPEPMDAEAPEPMEAVAPEDLWQAHPEDATVADAPAQEEPPVPTPEPVAEQETEPEAEPASAAPGMDLGEPMVTETMGDVYAAQGHVAQALEVYRQLLQRSPGDQRLGEKIAELESRRPAAQATGRGFAAEETGGRSVRSYFGDLLAARLPDSNGSPAAPVEPEEGAPPAVPGVMEEAFHADDEAPVSGEPTRPASGPLSLSAIFGEDSSPVPPVVAGPEKEEAKPQSSHFDEFFGERPAQSTTTRARSVRLDTDQDDLEQFHKWLKGLKR